jgi:hypothetical protein
MINDGLLIALDMFEETAELYRVSPNFNLNELSL